MKRYLHIILTVFLFSIFTGHAQQKHALIICVGEQLDDAWAQIHAHNDLQYVQKMLSYFRYDDIASISGRQATKHGIMKKFESLTDKCGVGDLVYIHFSGHGQRMTDIDGDESLFRENDWYDESWIPYDAYMKYCDNDKGDKHLSDDEIARVLRKIKCRIGPKGQILVVVDACHSGGSTRGDDNLYDGLCIRGTEQYFEMPDSLEQTPSDIVEEWLTLSACKDYQTNAECVSPRAGKLTYILYELRHSLSKMSNNELLNVISTMMNSQKFVSKIKQEPTLSEYDCEIKLFFQR